MKFFSPATQIEEWRTSVPLIIVSPTHEMQSTQELFLDHDYFGFDNEKVSKTKFAS